MQIARRTPVIGGTFLRPMKEQDAKAFSDKIEKSAKSKRPLAILLLGTVGSGKTTFLHYLRRVRLKTIFLTDEEKSAPRWLHLDFLTNPTNISASDFIYAALREHINNDPFLSNFEKCTQYAYASEMKALRSGPLFSLAKSEDKILEKLADLIYNDYQATVPYVDKIMQYATQHAAFFIAIDNVDQIEDENLQSRLFSESLTIARRLSLNLILCLRQSTYAKHRSSPAIDAFDFEAVQIDPPKIASVLSKRFSLVRYLANGKHGEFIAENGAKIRVENASQIIDLLQGSVLGTEIGNRIEVLATEDVRLALRMTREFLERGYTNPGRAIEYHRRTGQYVLPKHEAFRAIMLGTKPVYSEDFSTIGNPFDSRMAVTTAQLLRLYVLGAIVTHASENDFRFIDGFMIADNLKKIGFGDPFTSRVLNDLCKQRFLFTANHGEATTASSYVPSRLGGYVIRDLIANFTFLENTLFDTYIADPAIWQTLRELSHNIESERNILNKLRLRAQRVKVFFKYMSELLSPLVIEAQKRGLPNQWCTDVMAEREADLRSELTRVLASARRNYDSKGLPSSNRMKNGPLLENEDLINI